MSIASPGMYLIMNGLALSIYFIGAIILKKVPDYILKILFTIFILYYAYRMLFVL